MEKKFNMKWVHYEMSATKRKRNNMNRVWHRKKWKKGNTKKQFKNVQHEIVEHEKKGIIILHF